MIKLEKIAEKKILKIINTLQNYLHDKEHVIILSLIPFFSKGHLLIEDIPGIGKTTLSIAIASILGLDYSRIQCTSDLLPSDIIGVTVYDKKEEKFKFHKGPIFNNILLIDEINRANPKTQSALLEAMEECQVTVDGNLYKLPEPFFVIANQNPAEHYGTYSLPDSQLDRFLLNISIGYPSKESEKKILRFGSSRDKVKKITPIFSQEEILEIIHSINNIYVSDKILDYILDIVNETRSNKYIKIGLSTRGALALQQCAKTLAFFYGRDYVIPEDIIDISPYVINHRIEFKDNMVLADRENFIKNMIKEIRLPI